MSNPLVGRAVKQGMRASSAIPSSSELQDMYNRPAYEAPRDTAERVMTYDDVMMKTLGCFAVLLPCAVVGWFIPVLGIPAVLIGLVFGLINAFKTEPNKALILAYAGFQGLALGAISGLFEAQYNGIVIQAVLATLSVFGLMLGLFRLRIVRLSNKTMKFLMLAVGGYAVFSIVNFMFAAFSGGSMNARSVEINLFGIPMPLGVLIGVVAVVLASLTLVMDFQMIEHGVQQQIPERYSWTCAFSLVATLVWLYIEILRLLSYFRGE